MNSHWERTHEKRENPMVSRCVHCVYVRAWERENSDREEYARWKLLAYIEILDQFQNIARSLSLDLVSSLSLVVKITMENVSIRILNSLSLARSLSPFESLQYVRVFAFFHSKLSLIRSSYFWDFIESLSLVAFLYEFTRSKWPWTREIKYYTRSRT